MSRFVEFVTTTLWVLCAALAFWTLGQIFEENYHANEKAKATKERLR